MQSLIQFVILFTCYRLIPHPYNLTPLLSVCVFSGMLLQHRTLKFMLPIVCMLSSDLFLGFYTAMPFTYSAIVLSTCLGIKLASNESFSNALSISTLSSIIFFIFTNFGTWFTTQLYPHTFSGLMTCYLAGIPFYPNTLLSALGFSTLFWVMIRYPLKFMMLKPAAA